ncbi:hypothetical protein E4U34_007334 [Claviceps purpurea]|nr:hypothetical protein E4U34_007334 [Claviceps purpurea]
MVQVPTLPSSTVLIVDHYHRHRSHVRRQFGGRSALSPTYSRLKQLARRRGARPGLLAPSLSTSDPFNAQRRDGISRVLSSLSMTTICSTTAPDPVQANLRRR